jgi:DNA topoisomerase-1
VNARGEAMLDGDVLDRLRALRIPPGWTHVWASADAASPIQATGIDARGRTQYRYSVAALERSRASKFSHLLEFASSLPRLRRQIDADLLSATDHRHLEGTIVAAAVVRLLDRGFFRVGNERYARDNNTYGLTTLRRAQLRVDGATAVFDFIGKEHIRHHKVIQDASVAPVLRDLLAQDCAPTQLLFATSAPPFWRRVDSTTVNSYIHTHGAVSASAKTFRTWGATVAAAAVAAGASFGDAPNRRHERLTPYDAAAHLLGNTPAVARAAYVHPEAIAVGGSDEVAAAVEAATSRVGSPLVQDVIHDQGLQTAVKEALVRRSSPAGE